jgi:hypothetical protein
MQKSRTPRYGSIRCNSRAWCRRLVTNSTRATAFAKSSALLRLMLCSAVLLQLNRMKHHCMMMMRVTLSLHYGIEYLVMMHLTCKLLPALQCKRKRCYSTLKCACFVHVVAVCSSISVGVLQCVTCHFHSALADDMCRYARVMILCTAQ